MSYYHIGETYGMPMALLIKVFEEEILRRCTRCCLALQEHKWLPGMCYCISSLARINLTQFISKAHFKTCFMFYLPFIIFIYVYASVSMWIYAMYVGVYIQAKKRVFDTLDLKKQAIVRHLMLMPESKLGSYRGAEPSPQPLFISFFNYMCLCACVWDVL